MTLNSCKIPLDQDATGAIRVENTRVTLDAVVSAFHEGATAEEIAERFPAISLSAVYAAIAFYLQNRVELDALLGERVTELENTRNALESRPDAKLFRERLLRKGACE